MTGGSKYEPRPDQPDDEYPDFLWPDDDDQDNAWFGESRQLSGDGRGPTPSHPVPFSWPVPPVPSPPRATHERGRRLVALTATAVAALGLGAGAVLVYRHAQADSTPSAAAPHNAALTPGGAAPAGPGSEAEMEVLGRVTAVSNESITIGGGPAQSIRAAVTSATRFTGTVRTLASVRVGNVVEAQITVTNGRANLVSLQDPASES
ncbi:MAG TPA: hypothetical protein VME44_10690 [Streptosporangiaceae bacterium]|nr:hypothetical protein [Streptosporangiaceae bacterium]